MEKISSPFYALRDRLTNQSGLNTKSSIFSIQNDKKSFSADNKIITAQRQSKLYDNKEVLIEPLHKIKDSTKPNLGKQWFNLEPLKMDEKLKRDIKMIEMRNYIDPKRFYKNPDKINTVLHIGTVIEGPSEYKSARLTKRERKQSIVEEILTDSSIKDYSKRKYNEIQSEHQNKVKMYRMSKKPNLRKKKQKVNKLF